MHGGEEADQLCHAGAIAGAPSSNSETHGTAALESSLPARLDHIRDLHAASKLLQCHRVLTTTDHHLPPLPRSPSLSHIRRTCAESAAFYAALTDPDPARPWTPAYAGPDARVFHRGEEDGACELKVEGVVHAPVMALMGMVYEVELYGDVFGFVKGVEVLAETGEMEKAVRVGFAAPWPLAGREMAAFAYAVDDLDEGGAVVVVLRDVREGDVGRDGAQVEVPEAERGTVVRMEVRFAVMELRPQSATETDLKMMICVDPKLAFMPLAFVNWAARSVFRFSLRVSARMSSQECFSCSCFHLFFPLYRFWNPSRRI